MNRIAPEMPPRKVRVSADGTIVIPADMVRALKLSAGDEVVLKFQGEDLVVSTILQRIRDVQEMARHYFPVDRSLADELIAERRAEAARE